MLRLNRNSFLVVAATICIAAAWFLVQSGGYAVTGIVLAALVVITVVLSRLTASARTSPEARTLGQLAAGKPTLIEYYSDY